MSRNTNPNRTLVTITAASYTVSTLLLLYASASKNPLAVWGGYFDVALAVFIVYLSFVIFGRGKANPEYQTTHRASLNVVPLVFLGIWFYRNSLDFNILLPGLAWRLFLLLHILPYAMNLWRPATNE